MVLTIPIPTSAQPSTLPPSSPACAEVAILAELDSTNVEELRQWFKAKEAFIEAEKLREKKEKDLRIEAQVLTSKSKSFWVGATLSCELLLFAGILLPIQIS